MQISKSLMWIGIGAEVICWSQRGLADECDAKAAELAAREDVIVGKRTAAGQIPMQSPFATEMVIECTPGLPIDLYLNWDGAFPPPGFYDLAGRAGHIVIGASANLIREGAMKCQQTALRTADKGPLFEGAEITLRGVSFECQAFTRDGGGTAITIYRK